MQSKVDHFNTILRSNCKNAQGVLVEGSKNPEIIAVHFNGSATDYEVFCHRSYITITQRGLSHPEIWNGKDYGAAAMRIAKLLNSKRNAA